MFKEMYLADNLQAGVLNQAHAITTIDALKMATVRGALALGYKNLGRLEKDYLKIKSKEENQNKIIQKLLAKGYNYSDIKQVINNIEE